MKNYTIGGCAALLFLAATQTVHAQIITNAEIERGLRFRGTPSYDGESYMARYNYGLNTAPIYLNGNSRQLYYLDYLDRADRAEKFGYRMPIDPYFEDTQPVQVEPATPTVRTGFGFGLWRRR